MSGAGESIDWQRVRQRLEASNQALALALDPGQATVRAVQKRRAAYLAGRTRKKDEASGIPIMIFGISGERFAVRLDELCEISGAVECTPVPGLMDRLLGLVNLHGEIRPVLDTAALLDVPRAGAVNRSPGAVLYLKWRRNKVVGLGADHLEGISRLDESEIEAGSPDGVAMPRRFIKAITSRALAVIDVPALLAGSELDDGGLAAESQEGQSA